MINEGFKTRGDGPQFAFENMNGSGMLQTAVVRYYGKTLEKFADKISRDGKDPVAWNSLVEILSDLKIITPSADAKDALKEGYDIINLQDTTWSDYVHAEFPEIFKTTTKTDETLN